MKKILGSILITTFPLVTVVACGSDQTKQKTFIQTYTINSTSENFKLKISNIFINSKNIFKINKLYDTFKDGRKEYYKVWVVENNTINEYYISHQDANKLKNKE